MYLPWHLYVMAILYILAGLNHFRSPRMYQRIIPPALPSPKALNLLSGFAEVVLGIALAIPALSSFAAWGIIVLLTAVFPANIYMAVSEKASFGLPKWVLWLRVPLQFALIYWAWLYT